MALAQRQSGTPGKGIDLPGVTRPMTYEEYLASPEEMARYDILDGWKVYRLYGEELLTNPTIRHQKIERNIARVFEDYEAAAQSAVAIVSPCDVLIRERPARTRQPDVLLISNERLAGRSIDDPEPLSPAPELVVEIVSRNEKQRAIDEKIADYITAGVLEIWIVRSVDQSVERLQVSAGAVQSRDIFGITGGVESLTFAGLQLAVGNIFRI